MRDNVELLVGGVAQRDWVSYSIESDLMIPADAWQFELGVGKLPASIKEWQHIQVRIGNELVLTGRIDDIDTSVSKKARSLSLSGRDLAAVLVDCSAPVFSGLKMDLKDIVANIIRPMGISKFKVVGNKNQLRERVSVDVGDTAWDVLANVAEANGLWPWFDPDGTLVVGGPDYTSAPVDKLMMYSGSKSYANNVTSAKLKRSIRDRFSSVTVLGQGVGTAESFGKNALKGTAIDNGFEGYRPKVVLDSEADSNLICDSRARKILADGRLNGFDLVVSVAGHRTADGTLWKPGQRVLVVIEEFGIDGLYFLMGRRFFGGRDEGQLTDLTLKEDGVWLLDAHPHTKKHKPVHRHKKESGDGVENTEFLDYIDNL